jgi:1-acyl-sn-glycerol-3-phosphate acyltransferase
MNIERYFYLRRFSSHFVNPLYLKLFRFLSRKVDFEIPDINELRALSSDTKTVTVFISGKKSRVEQFILNGFLIENGLKPPSHSFGSKTVFFMALKELKTLFFSFFNRNILSEKRVDGLYIPVDSPGDLLEQEMFRKVYDPLRNRDVKVVPIVTLWEKELGKKSRWEWIIKITGKYHLWSTTWELLMLLLKRRKLTFRIGLAKKVRKNITPEIFVKNIHTIWLRSRENVVGVSLKSWLDIKNQTLFDLSLKDPEKIRKASDILDSISTKYSPARAEFYTRMVGKVLKTLFSKYHYSQDEITHLRRICSMPGTNMILVPTHRSYFDYLILNYLLYSEKVTVPLVAAGDNLSFFPLGNVLRQMGAFFIRRKIKDDPFYTSILSCYLKNVVAAGYDIEFFIEGGRSRSGMVRSPRTGMLKMLAENGKTAERKLYVVPVSVTYEKLKEVEEYRKELVGRKMPEKENFFSRLRTLLKTRYGPVYIRFARPVYLGGKFNEQTAFRIAEYQERATVISFSALFSTVFLSSKELSSNDVIEKMEYTSTKLKELPFVITAPAIDNLDVNCSRLIRRLVRKGDMSESDKKGNFILKEEAHHEFSYYKNSIAFAFAYFFASFLEGNKSRDFAVEFLETYIKGYNHALVPQGALDTEKSEAWFKKMVLSFFKESFFLLDGVLCELMRSGSGPEHESRSGLAEKLIASLSGKTDMVSIDEIFEIIFFLEKKSVLINNLKEIDNDTAEVVAEDIRKIRVLIEQEE